MRGAAGRQGGMVLGRHLSGAYACGMGCSSYRSETAMAGSVAQKPQADCLVHVYDRFRADRP